MKAVWKGTVIAESFDTVIVEGNYYFPRESVNSALLEPNTHTSLCPWKGTANYFSLNVNGERNMNAVWYYAEPKAAAAQIKGRVGRLVHQGCGQAERPIYTHDMGRA